MLPFFSDVSDFACIEESAQDVVLDAGTRAEIQASLSSSAFQKSATCSSDTTAPATPTTSSCRKKPQESAK